MKKNKLKKWVKNTAYTICALSILITTLLIGETIRKNLIGEQDYNYVVGAFIENTETIAKTNNNQVIKPYNSEKVNIVKSYYNKDADENSQTNSLIFYANTYMQNSGVLYSANEQFDVMAVMDGTITNISDSEILGKTIEIKNTDEIATIYQSVTDIVFKTGDSVKQGDIIAKSGSSNIDPNNKNMLHFEVYYKGSLIDPEIFYTMTID